MLHLVVVCPRGEGLGGVGEGCNVVLRAWVNKRRGWSIKLENIHAENPKSKNLNRIRESMNLESPVMLKLNAAVPFEKFLHLVHINISPSRGEAYDQVLSHNILFILRYIHPRIPFPCIHISSRSIYRCRLYYCVTGIFITF